MAFYKVTRKTGVSSITFDFYHARFRLGWFIGESFTPSTSFAAVTRLSPPREWRPSRVLIGTGIIRPSGRRRPRRPASPPGRPCSMVWQRRSLTKMFTGRMHPAGRQAGRQSGARPPRSLIDEGVTNGFAGIFDWCGSIDASILSIV
jgi:hypothetical protein